MKASSLALLFAATALAQTSLPSCAQSCVAQYTSGSTIAGCNSLDIACICSSNDFLSGITCCVAGVCDQADQQATVAYAQQLCATAGVTNLPTDVSCSSSSSSSTSSIFSSASSAKGISTSSTISTSSSTSSAHTSASSTGTSSGASSSLGQSSPTSVSGSTNSPTTSPVVPGLSTTKHGLSTGAKVGIAIGAVGVLLIALLIAFLVRRRRHRASKDNDISNGPEGQGNSLSTPGEGWDDPYTGVQELPSEKPKQMINRKELATTANDLELESPKGDEQAVAVLGKGELPTPANKHELEHNVTAAELQSPAWDGGQMQERAFTPSHQAEHELDAGAPVQPPDSQSNPHSQTFSQPFESFEPVAAELPTHREPASSQASSQTVLSATSTAVGSSSRIDELKAKREKIRTEKERLLKLQELDEMEAAVHREIMEEEERAKRDGSPR